MCSLLHYHVSGKHGACFLHIPHATPYGVAPQAVCRIFRIGQTKPTFIYRLLYGGTFEERIYERNLDKEQLFK